MDKKKRIEIVNSLINYLADHEKGFFRHEKTNRTARFEHDGKTLWFLDHYTNVSMRMTKSEHKTKVQKMNFSSGGTMWGLVRDFTDFIYGNDNSNGRNGYGGLYCTHWGWTAEQMKKMRDYAREIGYLKS
ncbi:MULTISPECIES: hypothetical protein [Bacillus cereus group]|uniref:Uncharacterized protein n=1 Tax=Bacillus thuringiensis TaxID=1428 RepID=A0A1C4FFS8_BACTU|nr:MULTISPECIES: hypothetical protein [Bacillus cereus group]MED3026178.1 hypothetical protein [Bacillus wiedmannii]TKI41222.1 hypothetical protein FC683_01225 [Bacillus cereus]SCC54712.1 Uncharacterized protein BTT61001_04280 [Bacillus thuringiensis]